MKNIELNGQQIAIPSSWADITLEEYEKWNINKADGQSDHLQYIANICKVKIEALEDVSAEKIKEIEECISFIFTSEFEPSDSIAIGGTTYYISPYEDIKIGDSIDLQSIVSEQSVTPLSDSLAVLCRPAGKDYEEGKAAERAKLFRKQSCEKMLPLINYFLNSEQQSLKILNQSLEVITTANQFLQDTKTFAASEDGIKQLPFWKRRKYSSLIKSLEKSLAEL